MMLIIAQSPASTRDRKPFPFEEAFQDPAVTQEATPEATPQVAPEVTPEVQEPMVAPVEPVIPDEPMTPAITAPVDAGGAEPMAPAPGRLPSMVGEPPEKIEAPGPGTPEDPAKLFEEVMPPDTPMQEKNRIMDVRQKVAFSLGSGTPLRITYTTLPKSDNAAGSTTQRVITPDYVYWAGTGRHVVVAWDDSKNDWRAFALERINGADLLDEAA
jgi:hypothetical protein